jgi:GT2 family glycosyltransferase
MIVDVIIPVYNQFDYVRNCINSVLRSSCSTKFEIIVVDDASTDLRLKDFVRNLDKAGAIRLLTNTKNIGFTRTVNLAMKLHKDRDVLLLNSDTLVYGSWLDRIVKGAYSLDRVATVNPMTNSNGSHISYYPYSYWDSANEVGLEVGDDILNSLAAGKNDGKYVQVHTTVGFCMFVKRVCLNDIGYFDHVNFPAYGEESDACYRARKAGWRHLIVGDVFVTHAEGKSFGEKKIRLMTEMFEKFRALHPEVTSLDKQFRLRDPVRFLRAGLDLARVRRLLRSSRKLIDIYVARDGTTVPPVNDEWHLVYHISTKEMEICAPNRKLFPNLETYAVPRDILQFNNAMRYLGIEILNCKSESDYLSIKKDVSGLPVEVPFGPRLVMGSGLRDRA